MSPEEAYVKAGRIAKEVVERGVKRIEEEAYILEICEKVEDDIIGFGGKPAFPCNVSQNEEAAHYTAAPFDKKKIERGALVKLDIGVHVEGFIADVAITIGLSKRWDNLVNAARETLKYALMKVEPGLSFSTFGGYVEDKARSLGYITIENLAGHRLGPYILHAGESVPNRRTLTSSSFKVKEAYAIEPFIVELGADAVVIGKGKSNIYRLSSFKKIKDKKMGRIVLELWSKYKGLPFASRWIVNEYGENGLKILDQLVKKGIVHSYPVLVEASNAPVAQFEHTILIKEDRIIVTTA